MIFVFFFKQKTAYEIPKRDWSSDVCSSDLETQQEVDELWDKLSAGGSKDQCGWLTDKFGVTWQIVPTVLGKLLGDKDPQKANRVMQAMLKMKKLDIKGLQ